MNKITYILTVLVSLSSYAQISVYQHDYPLDHTNTRINNLPNVEYNTFIRLNETEQHAVQTPISKTLKASDRIQIKPNFKGGPFNGGGLFKATMCDLNRDVVCLSHNELTDIEALKKFEIGIGLPDFLKDKIQTFIDTEDTINGINPYLSWQFDVKVTK